MNERIDWNLLARHFSGECSREETSRIRVWIAEDPAREVLLEELRQVWRMTDAGASPESAVSESASSEKVSPRASSWDTEALWERVRKTTQGASRETRGKSSASATSASVSEPDRGARQTRRSRVARPSGRNLVTRRAAVMGAVLVAIVVASVLWLYGPVLSGPATASAETKTFSTQAGQRAVVRLTDGTRVHLNVDSRLTLPANFGVERRAVRLEGEAFFEVTEDAARPFVVRAGEATTRVLGTAFDVSAYADDEETRVVVKEGRVAVRSSRQNPSAAEQDVVLVRHQMGRLLRSGEHVVRKGVRVDQHLAWMDGQLVFEDASFEEVTRKLERWYGLDVTLGASTAAPPGHLNARFAEDQPLDEVLSVIATAFGLEYERVRRKHVTFAATAA